MEEGKKNIFTSNAVLVGAAAVSALATIVQLVIGIQQHDFLSSVIFALTIACIITLAISFFKHDKNVMKGMMGALLALLFVSSLISFSSGLSFFGIDARKAVAGAALVVLLALAVNHFIINADRHSSPKNILANQILIGVFIGLNVIQFIMRSNGDSFDAPEQAVASALKLIFASIMIVSIESKLDAYRIIREENGWTEDKK